VAEQISEVAALHELGAAAPEPQVGAIVSHTATVLQSLQEGIAQVPPAVSSPLNQLRSQVDQLEEDNRTLQQGVPADSSVQDYLIRSNAGLQDLRRAIEAIARQNDSDLR
jgi:hypothetical protein